MNAPSTAPLYYTDPMNRTCTAAVLFATTFNGEQALVLDRTIFYPAGGGQPGDRGSLYIGVSTRGADGNPGETALNISDTQKDDNGTIYHILPRDKNTAVTLHPGAQISISVDWPHRFEYMQQHTGQHILSGALMHAIGAATVSVHQGEEALTIETDRESVSDDEIATVEAVARAAVAEDLAIRAFEVSDGDLPEYRLRRPTTRTGTIRLVEIDGFDLVACGGVHLPRTALAGTIKITGAERIRGRVRISAKIGTRADDDYSIKHRIMTTLSARLSSGVPDIADRVDQALLEIQDLHRTNRLLTERIAGFLTGELVAANGPVAKIYENEDPSVFTALGRAISDTQGLLACIINRKSGRIQWAIVITLPGEFPATLIRTGVLQQTGSKGGGRAPLWQGVCPDADEFRNAFLAVATRIQAQNRSG